MTLSFFFPVLTYPDPTPTGQVARALDLAATLGGEIHATIAEVDLPPISDPMLSLLATAETLEAEGERASRQTAAELNTTIRHQAGRVALPVSVDAIWSREVRVGARLAQRARTHDYTLLCLSDCASHRDLAEGILFESGGPAIVFPDEGPSHLAAVAIAWDNSRAAARALRDALPILALAERVIVLSAHFDKDVDAAGIANVIAFLKRHGIDASAQGTSTGAGRSVGESLQNTALANDCGLMVAGAFGHSRLREFVLGGVTRSILEARRLPVLMSH